MRIAFFSPLPPARTGIADYSAALIPELGKLTSLDLYSSAPATFEPDAGTVPLYQIGNNPWHEFAYRTALSHPGVTVLHEANLHHLMAEMTIRRDDWDAYLAEAEFDGGPAALAYARRVRALEVGPDYDGVPMLRRILSSSRGVIVHSRFVATQLRDAGFTGPIAVIPHGAWIPDADRNAWRARLGIDELTPLIGIFGFLKPYKRIAESLRAFRRLLRLQPNARLILAGETHPDFPLDSLLSQHGLHHAVRVLGFTPIDDFTGYLAATDIVLNLRFPTVGESSGTLLRSLGLGKAVLVSDVGSFSEFPDDVCLKVPTGPTEEDLIFEYLNLLVSRPSLARDLGSRARQWVQAECPWSVVAARYFEFLQAIAEGAPWPDPAAAPAAPAPSSELAPVAVVPAPQPDATPPPPPLQEQPATEDLKSWATTDASRSYLDTHIDRLEHTLTITPPGSPGDRILEMGAYLQITPLLQSRLGYGEVRGCYFGPAGNVDPRTATASNGESFACDIDLFDAEKDPFPYPDQYFATVLCCELIEHLFADPMHMMSEINRVLRPGGHLVLTTPNIASLRAMSAILQGYHPGFFPAYIKPPVPGQEPEARHNREYAPREVHTLLEDSGFEVVTLETGSFREQPRPELIWVSHLLDRYQLPAILRGDGIFAVGRKTGPIRQRYPEWLYS